MKSICVYCGARPGNQAVYAEAAKNLAQTMVEHGLDLVYGGGKVGLMGIIADEIMRLGGKVTGVIPQSLLQKERGSDVFHGLTELHVVDSMHTRKQMMADRADGFIAMPGGIGTYEELFETFTWLQLGYHHKPIGLLNVNGYYDNLLKFIQHTVDEGFLGQSVADLLSHSESPQSLVASLQARSVLSLDQK